MSPQTFDAGVVALTGLLTQSAVVLLLTLLLHRISASAGWPQPMRAWTWAHWALVLGLLALSTRLLLRRALGPTAPDTLPSALISALQFLYQLGRLLFGVQLLRGVMSFSGLKWQPWQRSCALGYTLILLLASAWLAHSLNALVSLQGLLLVPCAFLSWRALTRCVRTASRSGIILATSALFGQALFAFFYSYATANALLGQSPPFASATPLGIVLIFSPTFDLVLQVLLIAGLLMVRAEEVRVHALHTHSEHQRLERELLDSQRLRSMGWLVSGVAHDLNNPLTVILGLAAELEGNCNPASVPHSARVIRERAELCRGIVRSLAVVAGEKPPAKQAIDVSNLLARVARSVDYPARQNQIEVTVEVGPETKGLRAEPIGLEQALVNLATNGVQASSAGGRVTLSAFRRDANLVFTVEDDGPGVPSELRQRIFEPFFSTKGPGRGTGLGLALAKAIVQGHGGRIVVEERGAGQRGARFVLSLPLSTAAPFPTIPVAILPRAPDSQIRILVIDDDAEIRSILARLGNVRGWRVESAHDGLQALKILRESGDGFHAILCDLRMPGMDGMDLHDVLSQEAPWLLKRVLFVTGDRDFVASSRFESRTYSPVLYKPYDLDEVALALERIAQEPRADHRPLRFSSTG